MVQGESGGFFTYLFNGKNLKPTAVAGYRRSIADHLGAAGIEISHSFEQVDCQFS